MKLLVSKSESSDYYYFHTEKQLSKKEWDDYVKKEMPWEIDENGNNCMQNVEYFDFDIIPIIKK